MSKVALITGGAKRIGQALAFGLAQEGYDIALHYFSSKNNAQNTKKKIEQLGRQCHLFQADLSQFQELKQLVPQVRDVFPTCHVLINNASIFKNKTFLETDVLFFEQDYTINFKAPFFLTQAFVQTYSQGNIINFLDTRVIQLATEHFIYTLSKKSLKEFTRMAAKELAPDFRVNAICPGPVLPTEGQSDTLFQKKSEMLPLQQSVALKDMVNGTLYLLNTPSVTGECLFIDSGFHLQ